MSSATADSYPESVCSCRPPTPPTPCSLPPPPAPAPAVPHGGPVRRQLDFADAGAGGGGDLEDGDDFFSAVDVDDIVRGHNAKRQAPPCVCGRGPCAVQRDGQSGRWMYVCSSQPMCKHTALCEEVGRSPESPPAVWSHPKTNIPCVFDTPINHVTEPRTPINNVNLQGAGVTTPINVSPQAAIPKTQLYSTFQGAVARTQVHASPQGAGTAATIRGSPRGARSNNQSPVCQCTAGKCKILPVGNEKFYVCPIPKGQGACSYKVPVIDSVKQAPQTGDNNIMGGKHLKDSPVEKKAHANDVVQVVETNANGSANPVQYDDEWPTPFDVVDNEIVLTAQATTPAEVCQGSPSILCQPMATETPTKPSMPLYNTRSPMTPRSGDVCFGCGEKGHWVRYCPKRSPKNGCSYCSMPGHLRSHCPQLREKHVVD